MGHVKRISASCYSFLQEHAMLMSHAQASFLALQLQARQTNNEGNAHNWLWLSLKKTSTGAANH